jgi:hypothetical protein
LDRQDSGGIATQSLLETAHQGRKKCKKPRNFRKVIFAHESRSATGPAALLMRGFAAAD